MSLSRTVREKNIVSIVHFRSNIIFLSLLALVSRLSLNKYYRIRISRNKYEVFFVFRIPKGLFVHELVYFLNILQSPTHSTKLSWLASLETTVHSFVKAFQQKKYSIDCQNGANLVLLCHEDFWRTYL